MPMDNAARDRALSEIARNVLGLDTLEPRNGDGLDFSDQSVWNLKGALEEAYAAGLAAQREKRPLLRPRY